MNFRSYFVLFLVFLFSPKFSAQILAPLGEKDSLQLVEFAHNHGYAAAEQAEYINGQKLLRAELASPQNSFSKSGNIGFTNVYGGGCSNMDFELGNASGWTQTNGFNPLAVSFGCCPTATNIDQAIISGTLSDPYGGFPCVNPSSGNFSLRLGSTAIGGRADRIEQTFFVSPTNSILAINYAVVINGDVPNHSPAQQGFFTMIVLDSLGFQANCVPSVTINPFNSGLQTSTLQANGNGVKYSNWKTIYFDLSSHLGENVIFQATVYDCALSGHFAYVYLDGSCLSSIPQQNFQTCAGANSLCTPFSNNNTVWMGPGSNTNTVSCFSPTASGIYTCATNVVSSCPLTSYVYSVTVFPKPQFSVNISDTSGCLLGHNFSSTVSVSSGTVGTYWNFGDNQTSNSNVVSHTYSVTGNYSVSFKAMGSNGCSDSTKKLIRIFNAPLASFAGGSVCAASNITLASTASISSGSLVSSFWTIPSGTVNGNNLTYSTAITGANTLTLTVVSDKGCSVSTTNTVMVFPAPQLAFSVNGNLCSGTTVTLVNTSSIQSGSIQSYSWFSANSFSSNAVSPVYTLGTAGPVSFSLSALSDAFCSSQTSNTILILPSPSVIVNSGTICAGQVFTIVPSGASSYVFSGGINTVAPLFDTNYFVTGISPLGCVSSNTAIASVSVYALPFVSISGIPSICLGQSATLIASGANNYLWNGNTNAPALVVSPTSNSTYSVVGTDANGCQSSIVKSLTVYPLPVIGASANSTAVCLGDTVILNGIGAVSYVWSWNIPNNTPFFPLATAIYTVTGTDINGCRDSVGIQIIVNNLPTVGIIASSTVVCFGGTVSLIGAGAQNYIWSGGINNGVPFSPTASSNYSVLGTDVNGCKDTAMVSILVNSLPIISIGATSTVVCAGDPVTLSAFGANTFQWSGGITNNVPFFPTVSSSYTVTGTALNFCQNTASIQVLVNPIPNLSVYSSKNIICVGESATLTGAGANLYAWNTGENAWSIVVSPVTTTTYTLTGINANGCLKNLFIVQKVDECLGLTALETKTGVRIYPNPVKESFWVEVPILNDDVVVQIYNCIGQKLHSVKLSDLKTELNFRDYSNGVYFVVVVSEGKIIQQEKILKE